MPTAFGFEADSRFTANPPSGQSGQFAFDLRLQLHFESDRNAGPLTVFVNSRDGSMALDNPHVTLWALGMQDLPGVQIHHVIIRDGEVMACGRHPELGEGCMPMGGDIVPGFSVWATHVAAERFFASVPRARGSDFGPAPAAVRNLSRLDGYVQEGVKASFWFDPGRATIATQVPFLGPGVGIMKDQISRSNRVVRHAHFTFPPGQHSLQYLSIQLDNLSRAQQRIDLSRYLLIKAFTAPALGEAHATGLDIVGLGRQIQGIAREMEETCVPGTSGNECRADYRRRIQALEAQIHQKATNFARDHGLPQPPER
ncbi:MAG: hypothetical protein ACK4VV_11995 [Pseudomonas sp.]